jgi:hypothetical protein
MMNEKKCCKRVYGGSFSGSQCRRPVTVTIDGACYCSIHSPDAVIRRREKQQQRWDEKWQSNVAERAEAGRKAALLDVCKDYGIATAEQLRSRLEQKP